MPTKILDSQAGRDGSQKSFKFVGGKNTIIANDDAPLGRQPFLRLFAVGVAEDQPVYHGGCFLDLEIIK